MSSSLLTYLSSFHLVFGLLLQTRQAISFLHHQSSASRHTRLLAAKQICTFEAVDFPAESWPYTPSDMARLDSTDDEKFYATPRFVKHIDDYAIDSLTEYYREEMSPLLETKDKLDVLDMCSSWISHLPKDDIPYRRVTGIGMNKEELSANDQLTDFIVQDLNKDTVIELPDESFDVVCNVVSVDYLTQPLPIFKEMHRVLRPGGITLISFSNRCFATKAISMWLQSDDIGRLSIVGSYFHYSANWSKVEALDIKKRLEAPEKPPMKEMFSNPALGYAWMATASEVNKVNAGDPMFVVKGIK